MVELWSMPHLIAHNIVKRLINRSTKSDIKQEREVKLNRTRSKKTPCIMYHIVTFYDWWLLHWPMPRVSPSSDGRNLIFYHFSLGFFHHVLRTAPMTYSCTPSSIRLHSANGKTFFFQNSSHYLSPQKRMYHFICWRKTQIISIWRRSP